MLRAAILLTLFFLSSCLPSGVFEKNYNFAHNNWKKDQKVRFDFTISDTSSNYLLYLYLRHTDAYPYSNIWLNVYTTMPGDQKPVVTRVEVPLADPSGKWYARGMNEIREHKMPLNNNGVVRFLKKGTYTIQLEQIMRNDPLPEVMSAGIMLEKQINK